MYSERCCCSPTSSHHTPPIVKCKVKHTSVACTPLGPLCRGTRSSQSSCTLSLCTLPAMYFAHICCIAHHVCHAGPWIARVELHTGTSVISTPLSSSPGCAQHHRGALNDVVWCCGVSAVLWIECRCCRGIDVFSLLNVVLWRY